VDRSGHVSAAVGRLPPQIEGSILPGGESPDLRVGEAAAAGLGSPFESGPPVLSAAQLAPAPELVAPWAQGQPPAECDSDPHHRDRDLKPSLLSCAVWAWWK
jgi:hypothetical protein